MAQRATSLGPKPSLLFFCFCFCFFCSFPFFAFNRKTCFPPKKVIFCLFSVFLFLLPQPFLTSPFFCFSFSVSLLLLSLFILLVFLFCFLCVSCFCLFFIFLSSLLLFSEKNNMNILNYNQFYSSILSLFYGFLSCFCFQIPFPYLCFS